MTAQAAVFESSTKRRRLDPKVSSDGQIAFEEFLDANFFGQPEARKMLRVAYANYLNPLRDKNKPVAFLVFAGESRTGKTEAARMIPAFVHKNRDALLRIDCSEYMEKHSLWNLKGAPRGHISNQVSTEEKYSKVPEDQKHGYAELMNHNLRWSKKGSEAPLTVVLLDEWDKACYELNLLLLQVMDNGELTLGSGEVVDFRNTIFIAACNSGMREVEDQQSHRLGYGARERKLVHSEVKAVVENVIKNQTPPEFRNRLKELGGIAVFQALTSAMMKLVVKRDFKALQELITASGYLFSLSVTDAAVDEVLHQALANNGNLSNVKSLISNQIQIPLGIETTKRTIKPGDMVIIDVEPLEAAAAPVAVVQAANGMSGSAKDGGERLSFSLFVESSSVAAGAVDRAALSAGESNEAVAMVGPDTVAAVIRGLLAERSGSARSGDAVSAGGMPSQVMALVSQVKAKVGQTDTETQGSIEADGRRQSVFVQDFEIVLCAADTLHPSFKEAMLKGLAASPTIKMIDERTQYGDKKIVAGVVVTEHVTTVKVNAPIEMMFGLKRAMPFLNITTIATPVEL